MARVVYQTPVRVGGTTVQVQRTENMCEDWNWRTVKLIGFFIGAIAVFWWIFQAGSWFGGRSSAPLATSSVVAAGPVKPTGGGGTRRSAVPVPPTAAPTVIKVEAEVKVVYPPPAPPPPTGGTVPAIKKSGLPPRAW